MHFHETGLQLQAIAQINAIEQNKKNYNALSFLVRSSNRVQIRDVTITGLMINHDKIPDG